jgi:hypothetical protein
MQSDDAGGIKTQTSGQIRRPAAKSREIRAADGANAESRHVTGG